MPEQISSFSGTAANQKVVDEVFTKSATSGLSTATRTSNAALDADSLRNLLRPIFSDDIRVSTLDATITSAHSRVLYGIDKSLTSIAKDRIFIEITSCPNLSAAEAKMKDYLLGIQDDLSEAVQPAKIGTHSLQSLMGVFWVRDNIFASISHDETDDQAAQSTSKDGFAPPLLVTDAAKLLDDHIDHYAVPSGKESKPRVSILGSTTLTEREGEVFTITLSENNFLHEIKPVEIENQGVVVSVCNGSAGGEYKLYALKAGRTKVKIIAAHEATLASAYQEVDVIVQAA